ncbi:MAG TPA: rhodanese-like domain-containing protein [Candidatus Paceibacterota bacterium]|nr:rhodanese-like domain-containing protein [Candidatus Paceibacterota bacterium]
MRALLALLFALWACPALAQDVSHRAVSLAMLKSAAFQRVTYVYVSFANEHTDGGVEWKPPCRGCTVIKAPFDLEVGFMADGWMKRVRGKVVFVCRLGVRSDHAARAFIKAGYAARNVYALSGGMCAAGLNCEKPQFVQ